MIIGGGQQDQAQLAWGRGEEETVEVRRPVASGWEVYCLIIGKGELRGGKLGRG